MHASFCPRGKMGRNRALTAAGFQWSRHGTCNDQLCSWCIHLLYLLHQLCMHKLSDILHSTVPACSAKMAQAVATSSINVLQGEQRVAAAASAQGSGSAGWALPTSPAAVAAFDCVAALAQDTSGAFCSYSDA